MQKSEVTRILQQLQEGNLSLDEVSTLLSQDAAQKLQHATIDTERAVRTGQPETIFGEGKTTEQIIPIIKVLISHQQTSLVTRLNSSKGEALVQAFPDGIWNEVGGTFLLNPPPVKDSSSVAIICAGTSDLFVAEECDSTLQAMGIKASRITDIGVAGLHRLLDRLNEIRQYKILIVIAGMEGALATVMAGLVKVPIIAVPTSVGYGAHLGGMTPLLGMLTSCAPGILVCNIDNGYGAAISATRITHLLSTEIP